MAAPAGAVVLDQLSEPEFNSYLRDVVPNVIGGSEGELAEVLDQNAAVIANFVGTAQAIDTESSSSSIAVLVVVRNVPETKEEKVTEEDDDSDEEKKLPPFEIKSDVMFGGSRQACAVFIKRSDGGLNGPASTIAQQLRIVTFQDGSPFETLHACVKHAIKPYLVAAVETQRASDSMGKANIRKAITELELQLTHLQQNIEIPEIELVIHPEVRAVVDAAKASGSKPTPADFGDKKEGTDFLRELVNYVIKWTRQIQKVTTMSRDPSSGTAIQEVNFWLNLEEALRKVKEKRESTEVELTLEVLRQGRRFHATVSFDQDAGLAKRLELVMDYMPLMKDFPKCIDSLLKASDMDEIKRATVDIFSHLKRIRTTKYPVQDAIKLVTAISRDLNLQLLKVLGNRRLMQVPLEDFDEITSGCKKVFEAWDTEDEKFRSIVRETLKRRRDEQRKTFMRVKPEHEALKRRLDDLGNFRKQHEQLRTVIARVLRPSSSEEAEGMQDRDDVEAIEEVKQAYEDVQSLEALDLTEAGAQAWISCQRRYNARIEKVEGRIIAKLNDQLTGAKNATEMFRIFKKFNALFVRPRIRGAIREYQTQLIERVKVDIETLKTKFRHHYDKTMNSKMSEVRDLPPVSGQIIWARQIDRQLQGYLNRVEDVIGKGWETHKEGGSLKEDGDSFRQKLGSPPGQMLFDKWSHEVTQRQLGVNGRIFNIDMHRASEGNSWELSVNFHSQIITLSKEVRNLKFLQFRVPLVIVNKALQANHLYPMAISLKASIRTYRQTLDKLAKNEKARPLVASYHKVIQKRIGDGITLRWESYRLAQFVKDLAEEVFTFQDKVDELLAYSVELEKLVDSLNGCKLDHSEFTAILESIQKIVDDLNLKSYVNLDMWVANLDGQVEERLARRLDKALKLWLVALVDYGEKPHNWDARNTRLPGGGEIVDFEASEAELPVITLKEHSIKFRNQVMVLNPPAESARENLFAQLQTYLALITDLPRIQSSKFVMGADHADIELSKTTYRGLLTKLPNNAQGLVQTYQCINEKLDSINDYVKIWMQYQSLWDIQSDTIVDQLGDDLSKWQQLLVEIKKARKHFDTSETAKEFGPIVINFAQVQTNVNLKYDQLHKDILNKFGMRVHTGMEDFFNTVNKARSELESTSVDSATTQDSVAIITLLQGLKRKVGAWTEDVELFESGEKVLERQRYVFPEDWRFVEMVKSEWGMFVEILTRKDSQIAGQLPQLQMKVTEEHRSLTKRIAQLLADWAKNKPVGHDVDSGEALSTLSIFEGRLMATKAEFDTLAEARVALDLDATPDDRINVAIEELHDLKNSWGELGRIFKALTELKEKPWAAVVARQLRKSLDDVINELRNLPARVRSYASYEATMAQVQTYKEANKLIDGLKSEAMKERHWKVLLKKLGMGSTILADLTLGVLWDLNLKTKQSVIDEVMREAQGEMALEVFMQETDDEWATAEVDLVSYQGKTKLIRGWQELFDKCKDRLASLNQMKLSVYYNAFKEKAEAWDSKLNKVQLVFDMWMGVQEKWVYLEGIFKGSADIRALLPSESSRFESISKEFMALMKKVSKNPIIIEVIAIPNVVTGLERLEGLLVQIKKALADYLEKQRSLFPRFYFVGDDALLEIIGNSKDISKIQRHFRKLFAGVQSVKLSEDEKYAIGCESAEGETMQYREPVLVEGERINIWLTNMEKEISVTLASRLASAKEESAVMDATTLETGSIDIDKYITWVDEFQAQLLVLCIQVSWSEKIDAALNASSSTDQLNKVLTNCKTTLDTLADTVLLHQPPVRRKKLEHLITELVHQRDVTKDLIEENISDATDFLWLRQMRFYLNTKEENVLMQLKIHIANAQFSYGFEYLGIGEKLVQTPLTDVAYTTLTQALKARQGGSPFGPAGTGKTESVKMLGRQLGRLCLVFNCDETFDSQAMERILVGLCQVGAFGCFDEFNRLEEAQLSAVSNQIQIIQEALTQFETTSKVMVEVIPGRSVPLNEAVGVFITMNPGYAGRSELPDNLKKLFRNLAMTKPDMTMIAQVMLFSQGFRLAQELSRKVVPLFELCKEQLSKQSHYDFGLRALKAVLVSAGNVKRHELAILREEASTDGGKMDEEEIASKVSEQSVLIQSISQTMVPKLVGTDNVLLRALVHDVFPNAEFTFNPIAGLRDVIVQVCEERFLSPSDSFLEKALQLYQVSEINHGLMMVGPSGAGKSECWNVLLEALRRFEGDPAARSYVIDPKAISKDDLYGFMDNTTREWTDGIFTNIIRKIIDNKLGELKHRQWIVFDGDVDPEWVENLNSVLDDNKLLTLPNGERLALPPKLRVMFEVQDLKNATLATVSRCGMIWFSEDIINLEMQFDKFIKKYRSKALNEMYSAASLAVQGQVADAIAPHFAPNGLVASTLIEASTMDHIMEYSHIRAMNGLFCILNTVSTTILEYNQAHADFPMAADAVEKYAVRKLVYYLIWSLVGDAKNSVRDELSKFIQKASTIPLPEGSGSLIDYHCELEGSRPCDWASWEDDVPVMDIQAEQIAGTDVVIPTVDTMRHVDLMYTWLADHLPVVLCGPPGSGKTMTLVSALRRSNDFIDCLVNFSSSTTPQVILDTFSQYCDYRPTPNGLVLAPREANKWLVVFCDEMNLPATDKYNTVRVITFLRQLVERNGFWRADKLEWVTIERIQFVGACNPPTDPGRVPLSMRFLRHVPVIYVDYPSAASYKQIYGTFNRALMKRHSELVKYAEPLTDCMVDFFMQTQQRFTAEMQPFYIYSPREMTRWVKGIKQCIWDQDSLTPEDLVRSWAHEGLRLFCDRLVYDEEREWTERSINEAAARHFQGVDITAALERPILFSSWMDKHYVPVQLEPLREFVQARLKVFHEEELDVPLVLFDDVLDHVLRIDRIFKQNQGHCLLIGVAGGGKTTLSRFVAWMNGLTVFQVKVHNNYTADDFDEDLRQVLKRSGCEGEKIAFIMDEGNVMDTAFLERMNTLLANGEVPGLFEGDEYASLMTLCKQGSQREGAALDGDAELYQWFSKQILKNLHVVFTMNPAEGGMQDRASTSPALFNRCVLDWYGDWSDEACYQVSTEFTMNLDLEKPNYQTPMAFPAAFPGLAPNPGHREAVNNAFVFIHLSAKRAAREMRKREGHSTHVTPRHLLENVNQFVKIFRGKCSKLEEEKRHLGVGLRKLEETFAQVGEMQKELKVKETDLRQKDVEAAAAMDKIVHEQTVANDAKKKATSMAVELEAALADASIRKVEVADKLANVEPAVKAAEKAVGSVKKKDIDFIRNLGNPPATVKLVCEAVCVMLGDGAKVKQGWKGVRGILVDTGFIHRVIEHDSDKVTEKIKNELRKYTTGTEEELIAAATRASSATGALMTWLLAKLAQIEVLLQIEPLRNELASLNARAETLQTAQDVNTAELSQLEANIIAMKREFGTLEAAKQVIKIDKEKTEVRVDRAKGLLDSLAGEKSRWSQEDAEFAKSMRFIIGDALLAGSTLAYSGFFNQAYRAAFMTLWTGHLQQAGIEFKPGLSIPEYLSTPEMQLQWEKNGLPPDELCSENAIMIERGIRFPLVIDPAGQAKGFLIKTIGQGKVIESSFVDPAFRKNLESALRFGTPLLIRDADKYDPIMNPVLNNEVHRTGGRHLICVGDQEIDIDPNVKIVMLSQEPAFEFPPDLTSRVTISNFTVTRGSLQSQCLTKSLKAERPDVDEKRTDLLKQNGEFRARLFALENKLLASLNESEGSLLDDDKVIKDLQVIQKEAADIKERVINSSNDMAAISETEAVYLPLAKACSAVYFCLEQLHNVHFLYRHSLKFFLGMLDSVLHHNKNLEGKTDKNERLEIIICDLFTEVYGAVAPGMLQQDQLALAVELARLRLDDGPNAPEPKEVKQFLEGGAVVPGQDSGPFKSIGLDESAAVRANVLSKTVPAFSQLADGLSSDSGTQAWLALPRPEESVPELGQSIDASPLVKHFRELLLIQALRPDRVIQMASTYVAAVFGSEFLVLPNNLAGSIEKDVDAKTPILLVGVKGYDAATNVQDIAHMKGTRTKLKEISVGSASAFQDAFKAIDAASKRGTWVMLKNVHLAPKSLDQLYKKVLQLTLHPDFRLFLSTEINPNMMHASSVLMNARTFVFEPAAGVKASLQRTLSSFDSVAMAKEPAERGRMYMLVAWLHAVVQERLRYTPLGWSTKYEFGDPDLRAAVYTVDQWMTDQAKGRSNLPVEKIPFPALRELLSTAIYGGRISNSIDNRLLRSFVDSIFVPHSFEFGHALVPEADDGSPGIQVPEGSKQEHFIKWASELPDKEQPFWIGLPNNAEKVLKANQASTLLTQVASLQTSDDTAGISMADDSTKADAAAGPAWMRAVGDSCVSWLEKLPEELEELEMTATSIQDPLFRFFNREIEVATKLVKLVRFDLTEMEGVCNGSNKLTSALNALKDDLVKGAVPVAWQKYSVPRGITAAVWISDFAERVKQFIKVVEHAKSGKQFRTFNIWLGGLMEPAAFLTASRQAVAQVEGVSLEQLRMVLVVPPEGEANKLESTDLVLTSLRYEGAKATSSLLNVTDAMYTSEPTTVLRWTAAACEHTGEKRVNLPIYLNCSRGELIDFVDFGAAGTASQNTFLSLGSAIICSLLGGV
jgi:dynein heavy chain 1